MWSPITTGQRTSSPAAGLRLRTRRRERKSSLGRMSCTTTGRMIRSRLQNGCTPSRAGTPSVMWYSMCENLRCPSPFRLARRGISRSLTTLFWIRMEPFCTQRERKRLRTLFKPRSGRSFRAGGMRMGTTSLPQWRIRERAGRLRRRSRNRRSQGRVPMWDTWRWDLPLPSS